MPDEQLMLLLIPVLVIDLIGRVMAFVSIYRAEKVRFDNKAIWVGLILVINFFGWIAWFLAGREE